MGNASSSGGYILMNTTLEYYNKNAEAFTADTANVKFSALQNDFISFIPDGGRIMDFGCGSGRDSLAFIKAGYEVVSVDGSEEMCKVAQKITGQPVIFSTFQDYIPDGKFDGVWACASLLHLTKNELPEVISKLCHCLTDGGILYMSFKYGSYVGDRNGRFYTDMTEESMSEIMSAFPEMHLVVEKLTSDVRPGRENEKWLNVFYKK